MRSTAASKDPSRPPERAWVISRLRRVAASICIAPPGTSRTGGRSRGSLPRWVRSRYEINAPIAEISARPKAAKASSDATPNSSHSRFSAPVESKLPRDNAVTAAPISSIRPNSCASWVSLIKTSRGASRASSGANRTCGQAITRSSPVEISTQASAASSRTSAQAAKKLCRRASSKLSSVSVPGVTNRTTSRRTTDFDPRFLASAGSSSCSAIATRKPLRISASK